MYSGAFPVAPRSLRLLGNLDLLIDDLSCESDERDENGSPDQVSLPLGSHSPFSSKKALMDSMVSSARLSKMTCTQGSENSYPLGILELE